MKKGYYVVWVGRVTGVYDNWPETNEQVQGYSGSQYAGGFRTRQEAEKAYEGGYEKYLGEKHDKNKGGRSLF